MKKIIIITGGIGSGKSTVLAELAKLGAIVIEADKVRHKCMEPGQSAYNEVVASFGGDFINPDKTINRYKLGVYAFANREKLKLLEKCTHKYILEDIRETISNINTAVIALEIPFLPEVLGDLKYDKVVAVTAPEDLRIMRAMERLNVRRENIVAVIAAQPADEEYANCADYVIENTGTAEELAERVRGIYKHL